MNDSEFEPMRELTTEELALVSGADGVDPDCTYQSNQQVTNGTVSPLGGTMTIGEQ